MPPPPFDTGLPFLQAGELFALACALLWAVAVILFEGGLSLDHRRLAQVGSVVRNLVTLGAAVTAVGGAWLAHEFAGLSWGPAALFGAVVTVTGPTVIVPLLHHMVEKPHLHFYVTDEDGTFHGVVDVEDLRQVVLDGDLLGSLVIARDLVNDEVPRVRKEDTLDKVMLFFGGRRREELPVVEDGKQGDRLIGVMTRQALISAYNDEILKRDAVHEVLLGMGAANGAHAVHLGRNLAIAEVEAPGWMAGKTLAELDLRKKHGIQVLLIHPARERTPEEPSPGDQPQVTPKPDYTIHLGDDLVILGTPEAIQKIESHP